MLPLFKKAMLTAFGAGLLFPMIAQAETSKPATDVTAQLNQAVLNELPFSDTRSFEDARRGFLGALPDGRVLDNEGHVAWDMAPYAFLQADAAPDSVNPSLWRMAQLNAIHGLFEVVEGMYQVRNMDLSNMTIIEGDSGLIIIDPLLTPATARAGLELYYQHRSRKPVVAVLYTHNHADHFGGVKGVVNEEDVRAGKVRIYAPEGFMEHAIAENVIAGNAMTRRATYQFGAGLTPGVRGHVDTGLGKALGSGGLSLIAPTDTVPDNANLTIDGIEIDFQMAHGTEAESEMMMYFPQFRVLNTAEITSQHLHNIYTIRGAAIRDASSWSRFIDKVLVRFADRTDILVAQHHWPIWNPEDITHFLEVQRDLYKYIHDQTVRMMNRGMLPGDIAENLQLPESLNQEWSARGYYGTVSHNARGVYQRYMGWYDANPANLNPLPPREESRRTIDYMGGEAEVLRKAREDFADGDYRWVASVMRDLVYANPENREARELGADALEQLGYQAEAGTWRSAYLVGAHELRHGLITPKHVGLQPDLMQALQISMFFDSMAVRIDPEKAAGEHLVINWSITDQGEDYRLNLQNATLTHRSGELDERAHASVSMHRAVLDNILLQKTSFPEAVESGEIQVEGAVDAFFGLLQMLEKPPANFSIIEPVGEKP
ncbi:MULTISPECIES: alkyl sulfatase dimerization domain-containing protein [unclassified Marinobacter]|uniref:Linear primary-alkylsulfatase n=1 Tax=Marinobacter adhaerens TaxID=1033846 RepID=A0A352ITV5_9GAMM|nr:MULTISPECIES: alkyl sulfatase dimerization domain-containing protein [unclassified Marinobacter]MAK51754.1 alkyl/aryl-sulfatase [Marinobacter sp.]MAK52132.1 alkyl/aryl-sulfatase [Marinobacter sp.]HBC34888.1 alkyl/aryl-sulfatase [Marinobacter adhaerens]